MSGDNNSWLENKKLILDKLDTHDELLKEIRDCVVILKVKAGKQEVRAGIFGLLGGAIPVCIILTVFVLKGVI